MLTKLPGNNNKEDAFSETASIVLYLLLEAVGRPYRKQSDFCATQAGPLFNQRVLDMGCGFGTTTGAIVRQAPRSIVAVDNSLLQTSIYEQVLLREGSIGALLAELQTEEIVGRNSATRILQLLKEQRAELSGSIFRQHGGRIQVIPDSCLNLLPEVYGYFDTVVGNNFIHWPIKALRDKLMVAGIQPEEAARLATIQALKTLSGVLRPGGTLALLEPMNFVSTGDAEFDSTLTNATAPLSHPVFIGMDEMTDTLLHTRGLLLPPRSGTDTLFTLPKLCGIFAESGLELQRTQFQEQNYACQGREEMVEVAFATLPMRMARIQLPFAEKLEIARLVRTQAERELPDSAFERPMRVVSFVFVGKKI